MKFQNNRYMKKGFTLAELLIALGIVGVLAAILMPVVHNLIPNQDNIMAKRAFYTVQTAVSELINDPACYPDKTQDSNEPRVGFDDGYGYENCIWGGNVATDSINTEGDAANKFKTLMEVQLGAMDNNSLEALEGDELEFDTKDGMHWKFSAGGDFRNHKNDATHYMEMVVDVNGTSKGDNCTQTAWGTFIPACTETQTPDTFRIRIFEDGNVRIDPADTWAIDAVKATKKLTD